MNSVPDYDVTRWHGRRSSACVIIPVINEGERIGRLLRRIHALDIPDQADVIVVDGGSSDGSLEADLLDDTRVAGLIVKRGPGKLSAQLRCAYDFVLREGYDEIITIDGNNKDDPDPIPDFIAAIRNGYDFVQASRFLPGGIEENTPAKRRFAVRYIHAPALSLASGFHWTDTTQGFRAYSRRLLTDERVDIFRDEFNRYELLAYLNYRAPRLGYRCVELPTARRYPANEAVPTKIDFRNEVGLLLVLAKTCLGGFDATPPKRPAPARSGRGETISPGERLVTLAGYALLFTAALVTALVTSFHLPLDAPWVDLFQEGEYISPRLYFDGSGARPLLIHGQLDYLPAQLAGWLCPGTELVCTRAINSGLTALAALIFFFCAVAAVDRSRSRALAGIGALGILFAINRTRTNLGDLHQGAPATRDIGLLSAILFLILASRHHGRMGIALSFAGGLVTSLSAFFTYNRGLTGLLAIGVYIMVSVVGGKWMKGVAAAIGLAAGLLLLVLIDPGMAQAHVANIIYWSQHHDIWAYEVTSLGQLLRPALFYLVATCLVLSSLWLGWQTWRRQSRTNFLPVLVTLAAICALVLQQGMQRYDDTHLAFAVPWLFLLGLWMTNQLPAPERGRTKRPATAAGFLAVVVLLVNEPIKHVVAGESRYNLNLLTGPLPSDGDLVARDVRAVAALLRRSDPSCTYVLNNAAGLYELSSRKPCSDVMVPVYATGEAETRLIADLARTRPPVIVSRSADWFDAIDNRSLEQRTPRLASWIKANYPSTFNVGSYELRSRPPGSAEGNP